MKTLNVPTTNTRKRIHAAAEKCGWVEGNDGPRGDELVKGDLRINIGYAKNGRLMGATFYRQNDNRTANELGYTDRFSQIILWLGSVS